MPVRKKQFARARLGAVCVAASVVAGAITAPSVWATTTGEVEIIPRADSPVAPTDPDDDGQSDDDVSVPAPGETVSPSPEPEPEPTPAPSPTGSGPTPSPSTSPSPVLPPVDPSPPVTVPPAPSPVPPRVEGEVEIELRAPVAARLGALLRLAPRTGDPASPTPAPSDVVHIDGGPDVGGSAELGASVPAEDPTGRTDAVRVGSLHDGSGAELAEPAVWAPWGGALAVAGVGVVVLVLRGGRQIGR
ncbi:hypothetical protein ABC195_13190 [Microbacterium sp. 2P01SA-2]|uniref:hypothetical protein n=1 Tax=unclassified Microbacterium TaxID=2609290 RepID=UPI0039A1097E